MNLREVVKALKAKGHDVEFYIRPNKDGSIRITKIDGQTFSKSKSVGNKLARSLVRAKLSQAKKRQLTSARKNIFTFSKTRKKQIEKVQRLTRKIEKLNKSGYTLKIKNIKQKFKREGWKAIKQTLSNIELHVKGGAYQKGVEWWADYLKQDMPNTAKWLEKNADKVTWQGLTKLHDLSYSAGNRNLSFEQADKEALNYLKNPSNQFIN